MPNPTDNQARTLSDAEIDLRARQQGEATKLMLEHRNMGLKLLEQLGQRHAAERNALAGCEQKPAAPASKKGKRP